jgi:hypothetical protein
MLEIIDDHYLPIIKKINETKENSRSHNGKKREVNLSLHFKLEVDGS